MQIIQQIKYYSLPVSLIGKVWNFDIPQGCPGSGKKYPFLHCWKESVHKTFRGWLRPYLLKFEMYQCKLNYFVGICSMHIQANICWV